MTYNYRCNKRSCGCPRITFPKKIELYVKEKRCPSCGGPLSFQKTDKARNARRSCRCDGYPFPHTKDTAPWCATSKRAPTEDEYKERSMF